LGRAQVGLRRLRMNRHLLGGCGLGIRLVGRCDREPAFDALIVGPLGNQILREQGAERIADIGYADIEPGHHVGDGGRAVGVLVQELQDALIMLGHRDLHQVSLKYNMGT